MARPGRRQSRNAAMSKKDRHAIAMEQYAARKATHEHDEFCCRCYPTNPNACGGCPDCRGEDFDERGASAPKKPQQYEGPEDPDVTF